MLSCNFYLRVIMLRLRCKRNTQIGKKKQEEEGEREEEREKEMLYKLKYESANNV